MTKKVFDIDTEAVMDEIKELQPAVKQLVRTISSMTNQTTDSIFDVDAELTSWLKKDYKLIAVHYMGSIPEGHTVLYVLVRQ